MNIIYSATFWRPPPIHALMSARLIKSKELLILCFPFMILCILFYEYYYFDVKDIIQNFFHTHKSRISYDVPANVCRCACCFYAIVPLLLQIFSLLFKCHHLVVVSCVDVYRRLCNVKYLVVAAANIVVEGLHRAVLANFIWKITKPNKFLLQLFPMLNKISVNASYATHSIRADDFCLHKYYKINK